MPATRLGNDQQRPPAGGDGPLRRDRFPGAHSLPRVSILRAPVGYGKSLLAHQWLAEVSDSADIVRLTSSPRTGDGTHGWAAAVQTIASSTDALLFLDDDAAHDPIRGIRPVVDLLRTHEQVRLILCTRVHLPVEETLAQEFECSVLRSDALAFDAIEVSALAQLRGVDVAASSIRHLTALLGGWPAGVVSALSRLPDSGTDDARLHTALDAMVEQVWHRLTRELVDHNQLAMLYALSVVEGFTDDDAGRLIGSADTLHALGSLERAGVITQQGEHARSWEIPAYLRTLLRERHPDPPSATGSLSRRRLIDTLLETDRPIPAFREAVRTADHQRTVEILEQFWPEIANASPAELERALVALPKAEISQHRLIAAARSLATGEPDIAVTPPKPKAASNQLESVGLTACEAVALRRRGQLTASLDLFTDLARQVDEIDAPTRTRLGGLLSEFRLHGALAHAAAGDLGAASQQLALGPKAPRSPAGPPGSWLAAVQAAVTTIEGRRTSSPSRRGVYDSAVISEDRRISTSARRVLSIERATRSLDDLDKVRASEALGELETMPPDRDLWPYVVWLQSRYHLLWASPGDALSSLRADRAAGIAAFGAEGIQAPLLVAAEADILMSWGHGSRAASVLADASRFHPLTALARARLALQSGELDRASLTARRIAAEHGSWNRTRLEAQLVWAESETLAGGEDAARLWSGSLQTMLRLGMAAGPFALPGRDTVQIAARMVPALARIDELREAAGVRDVFARQLNVVHLTGREIEVIALLHDGLTLEEAAKSMFVTQNTIKSQVRALYRKLGVNSRAEAVVVALEHGLVG